MSINIQDLQTGDMVIAHMRQGYALQKVRNNATKKLYSRVPRGGRPQVAKSADIESAYGIVLGNDPDEEILRLQFGRYNYMTLLVERVNGPFLVAEIPYWAFKQLRLMSPISYEPHPASTQHPTFRTVIGTPKPYRTLTRVRIPIRGEYVQEYIAPIGTENGYALTTEIGQLLIP